MIDMTLIHLKGEENLNRFEKTMLRYEKRQKEFAQSRAYASERDAYMAYMVALQILLREGELLEKRCKKLRWGLRDLHLLQAKICDLGVQLLLSFSDENQIAILHTMNCLSYRVGTISAKGTDAASETAVPILRSDMHELIDAAKAKCLTCDLDRCAEMKCTLKKALDDLGGEVEHDRGCAYKFI